MKLLIIFLMLSVQIASGMHPTWPTPAHPAVPAVALREGWELVEGYEHKLLEERCDNHTIAREEQRWESAPKSLYEYFNMPSLAWQQHKDIRKVLAQDAVGPAGWWYPEAVLPHGCSVNSVAIFPNWPVIVTGANNGHGWYWNLENFSKKNDFHGTPDAINTISIGVDGKIMAVTYDKFVTIDDTSKKARPIPRNIVDLRATLVHPHKRTAVVVDSHVQERHNKIFQRKDWLRVVDLDANKTIEEFETPFYLLPRHVFAMAMHPEGTLFALGQGRKLELLNDALETVAKLGHDAQVSAVAFNAQGTLVATACHNGNVALFELAGSEYAGVSRRLSRSVDGSLYPDGSPLINEIKFHPNGQLLAIASQHGFIQFNDLDGTRLLKLNQHAIVKDLAFTPAGLGLIAVGGNSSQVVEGKDHAAVVWKQHQDVKLEQVLMRQVLKNYLQTCRVLCIEPEICTSKDDLVPWMAERFNLQEEELKKTWDSMPEKLQASIVRTLIYRASLIPHDKK